MAVCLELASQISVVFFRKILKYISFKLFLLKKCIFQILNIILKFCLHVVSASELEQITIFCWAPAAILNFKNWKFSIFFIFFWAYSVVFYERFAMLERHCRNTFSKLYNTFLCHMYAILNLILLLSNI